MLKSHELKFRNYSGQPQGIAPTSEYFRLEAYEYCCRGNPLWLP